MPQPTKAAKLLSLQDRLKDRIEINANGMTISQLVTKYKISKTQILRLLRR